MAATTDPNAVYYSYRGVGTNTVVQKFIALLDEKGIPHRGSESEPIDGSLTNFEEEIGSANIVVIFYSPDYFKSEHCMNEYANIRKNESNAATYFVKCEDFTFEDITEELIRLWGGRLAAWKNKKSDVLIPNHQRALANGCYIDRETSYCIQRLDCYFNDNPYFSETSLPHLVERICDKYNRLSIKNTSTNKGNTNTNAPSFKFYIQSNLIERDYLLQKLHDLVTANQFSNLCGFGGSGKTSLTYMYVQKFHSAYNQIAYVVVNKNIRADFVSQINETIHLFEPDDDNEKGTYKSDRYETIIAYLESQYKSDKPNLVILDINNADDAVNYCEDLANNTLQSNKIYPDGWKYLIVSREIFFKGRQKVLNLNKTETGIENTNFLKSLFLENAGWDNYKDFSENDFTELFKTIYYSPLLAKQLGIFLFDLPKKSVAQIREILYGDRFKNEVITGINHVEGESSVIGFLRNIIVFDKITDDKQKELLRHFIIWPADYIPITVIFGLLKDIFNSENELEDTLIPLIKRNIIAVQEDDGIMQYKLHGLIAESLREQMDICKQDYSYYILNIKKITTEFNYANFAPFGECIGYSLSEYDICNDSTLLLKTAYKLQEISFKYSALLYAKAIANASKMQQDDILASAYDNLANIQQYQLKEYSSAKTNYTNAITIREKLPKDNPKYQNDLGNTYNNLGSLLSDHFDDNQASIKSYEKSIEALTNSRYKTHAVYVTYAHSDPNSQGISAFVTPMVKLIKAQGIECYLDSIDLDYGENISDFEQAIGRGECVIMVFSEKYFRSKHCMYEFVQVKKGKEDGKIKKLICIQSGKCDFDYNYICDLHEHWGGKQARYNYEKTTGSTSKIDDAANKNNFYLSELPKLKNFFSDNLYVTADEIDYDKLEKELEDFKNK